MKTFKNVLFLMFLVIGALNASSPRQRDEKLAATPVGKQVVSLREYTKLQEERDALATQLSDQKREIENIINSHKDNLDRILYSINPQIKFDLIRSLPLEEGSDEETLMLRFVDFVTGRLAHPEIDMEQIKRILIPIFKEKPGECHRILGVVSSVLAFKYFISEIKTITSHDRRIAATAIPYGTLFTGDAAKIYIKLKSFLDKNDGTAK